MAPVVTVMLVLPFEKRGETVVAKEIPKSKALLDIYLTKKSTHRSFMHVTWLLTIPTKEWEAVENVSSLFPSVQDSGA